MGVLSNNFRLWDFWVPTAVRTFAGRPAREFGAAAKLALRAVNDHEALLNYSPVRGIPSSLHSRVLRTSLLDICFKPHAAIPTER